MPDLPVLVAAAGDLGYTFAPMEPLPVDVFQLQRRDPVAWTVLLSRVPELAHYHVGPMAGMRPYLAGVFERFLRAYRSL